MINLYPRYGFVLSIACIIGLAAPAYPQAASKPEKNSPRIRTAKAGSASAARTTGNSGVYIVKTGDTLYRIARTHNTTVEVLKSVNQLHGNNLQVGQRLRVAASRAAAKIPARMPSWYKPPESLEPPTNTMRNDEDPTADPPAIPEGVSGESSQPGVMASISRHPADISDSGSQPLRIQLASTGLGFLGVPYRRSGSSAQGGFDCSGFVKSLFEKFKISLPRSSREQYKVGEKVEKDKLEVGDLVFFTSSGKVPSHVGIYIGDNQIIHAARRARQVIISSLNGNWYAKRFLGARRLQDLWADEPPPAENKSN